MKKNLIAIIPLFASISFFAQKGFDEKKLIAELSENGCKCVDSIALFDRTKNEIFQDVHDCIDKQASALQVGKLLAEAEEKSKTTKEVNGKKNVNVELNINKNSAQYLESYHALESYMMSNCESLKNATKTSETNANKLSSNSDAMAFYDQAIDESQKGNLENAAKFYEQSVAKDPKFSYAWENLGVVYRKLGNYDKALNAYKKAIAIDPKAKMALQNIPIVYIYTKEYQKAIDSYLELDKVYPGDAEVYYGIGNVYFAHLKQSDKALDYICKAYRIYAQEKSPYRSDAESIIGAIYQEMKKNNQSDKFVQILKNNNINFE